MARELPARAANVLAYCPAAVQSVLHIPSLLCVTTWHSPCRKQGSSHLAASVHTAQPHRPVWSFHNSTSSELYSTCDKMLPIFRRSRIGTAQQYLWHTTPQRIKCPAHPLILRSMATRRNDPGKEKKPEPKHRIRTPAFLDERVRSQAAEFDVVNKSEQARLWAKLRRAEARLPTGSVADRSRALDRIYADLVANSAVGSFASSERGRKLTDLATVHDMLVWAEEQRRLEKAIFFTKMRAAGLWIFAPLQDVGILVRLGRVCSIIGWLPMFVLGRIMTLPLPLVRMMAKREKA